MKGEHPPVASPGWGELNGGRSEKSLDGRDVRASAANAAGRAAKNNLFTISPVGVDAFRMVDAADEEGGDQRKAGMSEVVYLDALGAIEPIGGVVKLELLSILPRTSDEGGPWAEVCHRLVMHRRALTDLAGALKSLADQLEAAGLGADRATPPPAHRIEQPRFQVPETLVEGVGPAGVESGFVRVELTRKERDPVSLRDELRSVPCARLVMPPGTFYAAAARLEAALEEMGIRLLPNAQQAKRAARSPNFGEVG